MGTGRKLDVNTQEIHKRKQVSIEKAAQRVSVVAGKSVDVQAGIWTDVRGQDFSQALEVLGKTRIWTQTSMT